MPYHVAISLQIGIKTPVCNGDVHWFTVNPNIGLGIPPTYNCQCKKVKADWYGFKFIFVDDPDVRIRFD